MAVCRYFLQGTCRFGNRCRFEHPQDNSGYNRGGGGGDFDLRQSLYRSNQNSFGPTGDGGDRYNNRSGHTGGYDRQGGGSQRYNSNVNNSSYNHNRFSALSDHGGGRTRGDTSQADLTAADVLKLISQDMEEWNKTQSMWSFSCYSFTKEKTSLPDLGLEDLSPEEVRLKAYEAQVSGDTVQYKNWYNQMKSEFDSHKKELITQSPPVKSKLTGIIEAILRSRRNSGSTTSRSSSFGGGTVAQPTALFGQSATTPSSSTGLFGASSPVNNVNNSSTFGGSSQSSQPSNLFTGKFSTNQGVGMFGDSGTSTGGGSSSAETAFGGGTSTGTAFGGGTSTGTAFGGGTSPGTAFGGGTSPGTAFGGGISTGTVSTGTASFGAGTATGTAFGGGTATGTAFGGGASIGTAFGGGTSTGTAFNPQSLGFSTPTTKSSSTGQTPSFGAPTQLPSTTNPPASTNQMSAFPSQSNNQQSTGAFGSASVSKSNTANAPQSTVYTVLDELTAEERAAFDAPKFKLGKVPTRPPAKELVK